MRAPFKPQASGFVLAIALVACAERSGQPAGNWDGQVDTLDDGRVVVQNELGGTWPPGLEWRVTEDLRIGSRTGLGPESFGEVESFAVDEQDRFWILDGQTFELHVFDRGGRHLQTIGGEGSGPGEFRQPVHVDIGPEGHMWVMDAGNARVSVFDDAGVYLRSWPVPSTSILRPWQGGFDSSGRYHVAQVRLRPMFRIDLARFDTNLSPLDTLLGPTDPVERKGFSLLVDGREIDDKPVPFQGGLVWRLSREGTIWALLTDQYRLFEIDELGDTLRMITKRFTPVPVTEEERREALQNLEPFIARGGDVDVGRIPDHKPAVWSFFLADDGHIWVRMADRDEAAETSFEVFNPIGQYMGVVTVPFRVQRYPSPIVRDDMLYAVAQDELDAEFVVRARIVGEG